MDVIRYPEMLCKPGVIFLGGSTAKGDWQEKVADHMKDTTAGIINTSRPDWNDNPPDELEITDHIYWEMDWLNRAMISFICIPADAKSPTVLLELGMAINKPLNHMTVVYVDPEYPRFLNVSIACSTVGIRAYTDFDEALKRLKNMFLCSYEI